MMESSNLPKVTIVTLLYNTGTFVLESLECVKRQNYPNIEHIIIDDCSTDDSLKQVKEWIKLNNYNCILIENEINRGVHYGLNTAIEIGTGKYLAFISDDLWIDNKLKMQIQLLESLGDEYAMIYSDLSEINEDNQIVVNSKFIQKFGKDFKPPCGDIFIDIVNVFFTFIQTSIIRLEYIKLINFTFDKRIISEDWHLALVLSRNFKIFGIADITCFYRIRKHSIKNTLFLPGNMGRIYKSHILMFQLLFRHNVTNKREKEAILNKLIGYTSQLIKQNEENFLIKLFYILKLNHYSFDLKTNARLLINVFTINFKRHL